MNKKELQQLIKDQIQYEISLLESLKYNINDIYPPSHEQNFIIEFEDESNIKHITKGKPNKDYIEIKLYWVGEDGKPSMEAPDKSYRKIMNTHISNIVNKFLPNHDKFLIRPNDDIRYRLFELLLNKYVSSDEWNIKLDDSKKIITLNRNEQ
ncbi:MAG: hypothetical protein H8E55_49495 [Pelagibacterales bacterium]|nr:hypothetical protein [Pelagibacterales bacterium]